MEINNITMSIININNIYKNNNINNIYKNNNINNIYKNNNINNIYKNNNSIFIFLLKLLSLIIWNDMY